MRGDFQDLAEYTVVCALVTFGGDDLDACALGKAGHHFDPTFAVGIAESDQPDRLDVLVLHVLQHDGGHLGVALRRLEHPAPFVDRRLDDRRRSGEADHRRLAFGDDIKQGQRIRRQARADDRIDALFRDQFARTRHGGRRVGGIVEHDVANVLPAELLGQDGNRALLGTPD